MNNLGEVPMLRGYAQGGLASAAGEVMTDLQQIAEVPGGIELLVSQIAKQNQGSGKDTKQLRLYNRGGPVGYEEGGLTEAAELVRDGGRGSDEILLHVSPEEYEALTAMWGEPDINPETGLPEYGFLSKIWKKVKKIVKKVVSNPLFQFIAPVALNMFVPGIGSAVGGMLGATGKAASVIGNTLVRAGIGAAGGGKEGALAGALSGATMSGAGGMLGKAAGLEGTAGRLAGDAFLGGVGSELGGGDFTQGALGQAMTSLIQPGLEQKTEDVLGSIFKPTDTQMINPMGNPMQDPGAMNMFANTTQAPLGDSLGAVMGNQVAVPDTSSILDRGINWVKENPMMAMTGASLLGSTMNNGYDQQPPGPGYGWDGGDSGFDDPIPAYDFNRDSQHGMTQQDYYTYGQAGGSQPGEYNFFSNNTIGQPSSGSGGGAPLVQHEGPPDFSDFRNGQITGDSQIAQMMRRLQEQAGAQYASGGYAKGAGSGRDDTIEALLSDGEYVMDAETVSLLGDGSNDEGARRLDELREKLRQHKGAALSKGEISPDAKRPEQYLAKGGSVRSHRAQLRKQLKELRAKANQAALDGDPNIDDIENKIFDVLDELEGKGEFEKRKPFAKGGRVKPKIQKPVRGDLEKALKRLADLHMQKQGLKKVSEAAANAALGE